MFNFFFFPFSPLLSHVLKFMEDTKEAQVRSKNPSAFCVLKKGKIVTH